MQIPHNRSLSWMVAVNSSKWISSD